MCRTEVSERAWFVFLRDEKGIVVEEAGRRDHPMTLGERPPDLLREFVRWFEKKASDGYAYEIPTVKDWLGAFSGVSDPRQAFWQVTEWFRGERRDSSARFNPAPSVRYGMNKVSTIGSRPENRTPTGLLDMEANVQEVVLEGEVFRVIGGSNQDAGTEQILDRCRESRPYDGDRQLLQGPLTGFRLCRRPAEAR